MTSAMTDGQFETVADLIRASGLSRKGCKRMLVDGLRQCEAARELNINPALLAGSVRRYKQVHERIKKHYCYEPNSRRGPQRKILAFSKKN